MRDRKMRYFACTFLCAFHLCLMGKGVANNKDVDSLLQVLDASIETYPTRDKVREQRIGERKKLIANAKDSVELFDMYGKLYEDYKSYQTDSAADVVVKRIQIAKGIGDEAFKGYATLNNAEVMMTIGLYDRALQLLARQEQTYIDASMKPYLFHLYHSIFLVMRDNASDASDRRFYSQKLMQYKDSILATLTPKEPGYYFVLSSAEIERNNLKSAMKWAKLAYSQAEKQQGNMALAAAAMASVYEAAGNHTEQKKYLTLSAIYDIENGTREYTSLRKLAYLLYREGDIERSYNYIRRTMEDAVFSNARFRTFEISQFLPIISSAYDQKIRNEHFRLKIALGIISVLTILLVIGIVFIYRQLKVLTQTKHSLRQVNGELQAINESLNEANERLQESDKVKEEYVGYVFTMCSSYIEKMADLHKLTNRKIKAKQFDELLKITSSGSIVQDEMKTFYQSFDSVFLKLFPNFINDFNGLLHDEARITPKEGELLTPELRIFALVRLGISESTKIAQFLHYSPQTVYNYRLKVRSKAKTLEENFPQQVARLGKISSKYLTKTGK